MPTMHVELKQQALSAFLENPVFGLGPGGFRGWLSGRQQAGTYPPDKPVYDPHSLYSGMVAEGGLVGTAVLVILLGVLGITFWEHVAEPLTLGLGLALLYLLLDGVVVDILNFRHFWILLGLWGAIEARAVPMPLTVKAGQP